MFAPAPRFLRGSGGSMLDPVFFRVKHGCEAGASDAKNSRVGAPLRNSSLPQKGGRSLRRQWGAWPRPLCSYHFSRKMETEINRYPAEPWPSMPSNVLSEGRPRPDPAGAGCIRVLGGLLFCFI